ncbi:MAG: S9 family peptidase [Gemmatimonadetes bacterium]|nr:S9 family peptidase [Gemmatimonadota bacterium]
MMRASSSNSARHAALLPVRRLWVAVACALTCTDVARAQGPGATDVRPPFDVATQMRLRSVVDAALAPDGRRIAFVTDAVDARADRHVQQLAVLDVPPEGERVSWARWAVAGMQPRWSPDSRHLAFLAECAGAVQLWIATPPGPARCRTHGHGDVVDAAWSPDGRRVALLVTDAAARPAPAVATVRSRASREGAVRLVVLDPATGTSRQLTSGPLDVDELSWSPRGDAIAVAVHARDVDGATLSRSELAVVRVADGAIRMLVERPGMDASPQWSPDGASIAFLTHGGRSEYLGDTFVSVISAEGGPIRDLTTSLGERQLPGESTIAWRADSRSLFVSTPRRQGTTLLEVDVRSGTITDRTPPPGVRGAFTFDARTARMAFLATDARSAWELYASPVDSFVPRRLTFSNPMLDSVRLGTMTERRWVAPDGRDIEGLVLTPRAMQAGRRYPTILFLHGGPAWSFVQGFAPQGMLPKTMQSDVYSPQVLAALGYVVLMPNPRGSIGRGHEFRMANVRDWGGGDLADAVAGLDALVASGIADSMRLGVMGHSYGGTLAGMAIARTSRFRAAAIGAAIFDPGWFYGSSDLPELIAGYFGGSPWDAAADSYRAHAVSTYVRAVLAPTLLLHGERDRRVPLGQSEAFLRALRDAGVVAELVTYPSQGHGFSTPSAQRDAANRVVAWLTRHVPYREADACAEHAPSWPVA